MTENLHKFTQAVDQNPLVKHKKVGLIGQGFTYTSARFTQGGYELERKISDSCPILFWCDS